MDFSAEKLKYMAAEVVSNYLVNRVPLSEAVASTASNLQLNPEQVRRLVEISNQVAYLKLLEKATDRTFEFPLAKYEDVMVILTTPDENMSKEASHKPTPMEIALRSPDEDLEKIAQEEEDEFSFLKKASKEEKLAMVHKELYRSKSKLEKIAGEEQVLLRELITRGLDLKEDDMFMNKVASVVDEDDTSLVKISRLIYGEDMDVDSDELFYESDLEDAREYVELFKQAEELVETRKELELQIKKAEEILYKEAFAPAITSALEKVKGVSKVVSDKVSTSGSKALDRVERATFVADQITSPKRDVWKSIRGK